MGDDDDDEGEASVLRRAIAKQEAVLRSMQSAHGEFHPSVSDDLAQLALLYNMSGEFDKALPILHKRLVIHEKYGPEELAGESLQALGTVYRLHGVRDVAQQHLERALAVREHCHGRDSLKVAETLNSLALVAAERGDAAQADALQLRSLAVLGASAEPEDSESEDVPWEVYKRLKQQRGPSTARNSVTLFKDTMRKRVAEAAALAAQQQVVAQPSLVAQYQVGVTRDDRAALFEPLEVPVERLGPSSGPSSPIARSDVAKRRVARSHSDSGAMKTLAAADNAAVAATTAPPASLHIHIQRAESSNSADSVLGLRRSAAAAGPRPVAQQQQQQQQALRSPGKLVQHRVVHDPITDLQALQHRVELVKRRIGAGFAESDDEIARLVADVDAIAAPTLRDVGFTMLSLVREMNRLRVASDAAARRLPVLEGLLEKKSASIFRGWERRWFKVDATTFILSYHYSKDDYARGFAPRGGFPLARVANIVVHRDARGAYFHFDIVVDLSTRLNPHAARTYELRCVDQDTLRYWVETLHFYKATAQATPTRPSTS